MSPGTWRLTAVCGILLTIPLGGCDERGSQAAGARVGSRRIPVEVLVTATRAVRPSARVSADLAPLRQVVVAAESAGRVRALHVELGATVRQHQLLATIDATKAGHNLALTRAQEEQARASLDKAQQDLRRAEQLAQRGVTAPAQLDAARSAVRLARANVSAVVARGRLTASSLADSRVLAPFAGSVAVKHVELGDYLAPGRPIVTLMDLSRLKVKASLSTADAVRVRPGDPCQVRVDLPGVTAPLAGVVKVVGATADPRSRRVVVEVELDNREGRLKPGMIADVSFMLGPPVPTLLIPTDAVVEQFEIPYAFVVEGGRQARRRRLTLGRRRGLEVTVERGLAPGQQLVVVGQESLTDGSPVEVVKVIAPRTAASPRPAGAAASPGAPASPR